MQSEIAHMICGFKLRRGKHTDTDKAWKDALETADRIISLRAPSREPEGGAVDWDANDQELIERGLRTIRTHDAVRYLREALTATTVRLTGYDWNADPDGVTKQQGDAFAAADRVFADLDAAVASHPETELPECQTCGGTGKIEEAARMEGANKHSACIRTCDDCDGCGFAPDDEPAAIATREEAPAEAGEPMTEAEVRQWIDACNHEPARQVLRDYLALRAQPQAREAAQSVGWLRAVDEEMVCAHLGVADAEDSFETAKKKLASLIQWNIAVATDPSVGGHPAPDALRDALADLASWFTKPVQGQNGMAWAIPAGERGADDAVNAALAALQAEQGAK